MNDNDLKVSKNAEGVKLLAVGLSIVIYLCFVGYSEYHFFNLIARFVPAEFRAVGLVAVAASGFTALTLPLAIHFWFRQGQQLVVAYLFYVVHLLIVTANLIVDGTLVVSGDVEAFTDGIYAAWILPAYIVLYGAFWTVLWFLDDGSVRLDNLRELEGVLTDGKIERRISVTKMQSDAIQRAFQSRGAIAAINEWAARSAPGMLAKELGMSVEEFGDDGNYRFWMPDEEEEGSADPSDPSFLDNLKDFLGGLTSGDDVARRRRRFRSVSFDKIKEAVTFHSGNDESLEAGIRAVLDGLSLEFVTRKMMDADPNLKRHDAIEDALDIQSYVEAFAVGRERAPNGANPN
jgi:hypothetical protein